LRKRNPLGLGDKPVESVKRKTNFTTALLQFKVIGYFNLKFKNRPNISA
jgi:hypothetical protein